MSAVLTGSQIEAFRWSSLRGALKLEKLGMKRSVRPSARQIVLKASGLPAGTSYDELIQWCTDRVEEFSDV